jgi:branched-chain amino acid transport system ATP-binding protein
MTEPVVETRDLSVRFGGVLAVNNVTFTLRERELRCLIGPNGAGKSTFFKSIVGQIKGGQASGRVLIRGEDVAGWSTHQIVRLGVGIKTQVPSVMNGLTVSENLWLSARRANGQEGARAVVDEVVAELALEPIARHYVGELAHGQRQLVEIGIVLAHKPWLVLLDEPAAGITSAEIERLVSIINKVNRNATVIVVDHDMHFVRMLAAPITVFHQGAILIEGPGDKVLTDPQVREVYLGRRSR